MTDEILQHDVDFMMTSITRTSMLSSKTGGGGSSGLPQLRSGGGDPGPESPHSAAPSPLVASQSQPSVTQNGDPTMPTLSPHPPPPKPEKDLSSSSLQGDTSDSGPLPPGQLGPGGGGGGGSSGTANTSTGSGTGHAATGAADVYTKPPSVSPGTKVEAAAAMTASSATNLAVSGDWVKQEGVNTWLENQRERQANIGALKRPSLPTQSYETEDNEREGKISNVLYDFTSVHSW